MVRKGLKNKRRRVKYSREDTKPRDSKDVTKPKNSKGVTKPKNSNLKTLRDTQNRW